MDKVELYGLDFVRADGNTASDLALSPTNGILSWINTTASKCIDISIAQVSSTDDLFLEICHVSLESYLSNGSPLVKAQVLGPPATDGCGGYCSTIHIHIAPFIGKRGNPWVDPTSMTAVPFVPEYGLELDGHSFHPNGTDDQYGGTQGYYSSIGFICPPLSLLSDQCGGGADLNPPDLLSPNNGEILDNRSVHFAWQSPNSPNQTGYTFRLNTSANPDTQPWLVDTGLGNEYTSYDHTFAADGTFYWHMRTWNESGEASAWVTRQFHIDTANESDEVKLCGTDNAADCWFFPTGVYSDLSAWGLNDWARSVEVPSGKSAFLFREGGLRGTAECYSGDRIPLPSGDPWDLRGQVTGVQTFNQSNCPTAQLYSVVMYDHQNYGSHHWGIGYNEGLHNLNQIGGPDDLYFNDRGESVRIPNGWSIRLYEHNDRGGQVSGCLIGDVSSLGSLNNTVSSVDIFHNAACTPPTPTPPSNLSVSGTTDSSISLAWQDNSSNETSFKIYRWGWNGTVWDFLYLDSVAANVTSYTDTGLNCGETRYYTVSAVNNGSESAQADWVQGETAVCPTVEITNAWTGDSNWSPKSTFDPGDAIQWVLTIVNTTGADADIDVSYDVYGPTGEHVLNWSGVLTVSNGGWDFGLPGTVADGLGGTNSFDGAGNYQGHITLATTTYLSTGPTQIHVGTEQNGSQVTLTWTHQPQNTTYEVWHSPSPYFTPGNSGSSKLATLTAPTSEFTVNMAGFYKVKTLNTTGSVISNEVGIFNFPISSGEPPTPTYNWSLVNQSIKPSARAGVALAVDTSTNDLVLFGGTCAGFACGDTWVYDGNSWQELNISGPSPRENARMVYDSSRQRIVLFGGHVWAGAHLNDTWEFDGSSWSQINTNNTPLGRSNQAMTYDPVRGKVIMFGGWRGTQTGNDILSDTWEYDGTDWTQVSPAHSPTANAGPWMSYVPDWSKTILSVRNGTQQYNQTWAYDGVDWTEIGTPTIPRRYNYQMAYNPLQQRLVLFGGYDILYHSGAYADTWEFDGQQWVEATPTTSPPATWASEAVYYAPLNGVVIFGGNSPNQNDLVDTMWRYGPNN
ncbi:MAG: fibronectin type III domain-containing protein [Ardenticatenaceae bacterium]|nr:fibronectin type III domain-containing protein [Ardenticatenaceae bacterium]